MRELFEFEDQYTEKGYTAIAGIDEAGRGPLAGPVVAACTIMPLDDIIEGINDSKKLSEKKREALFEQIKEKALAFSIVEMPAEVIDDINILEATKKAMIQCATELAIKPDVVFIDAVKLNLPYETLSIIKGDARSYNIAAASILAKVHRDRLMREYAKIYPEYGFAKHKGYGTSEHIRALKEFGPCPLHRALFIRNFIDGSDKK